MSIPSASLPVTLLVTSHIATDCYGAFLSWMRQGVLLPAGYPGFLWSGALQPPEGGEQYEIVLSFSDEASLRRWENSLPRRMWLERGKDLVKTSQTSW